VLNGMVIVDATIHGYNWTRDNWASPLAERVVEPSYGFHAMVSPDHARLDHDEWVADWTPEMVEPATFAESPIDLACYHATPQFDFFRDGQNAYRKGVELKRRNPGRMMLYGAVNPYHDDALEQVRRMKGEDDIDGVKVFAASFEGNRPNALRLDTHDVAFPFIEGVQELGIRVIASHKAVPLGPNRPGDYDVDDLAEPAAMFPEMNFEIVHSGFAFLEDTALLMMQFPNVWSNLEATNSFVVHTPARLAEIIGRMMDAGAGDRIVFSSGVPLVHPLPVIEGLLKLEMPRRLVEEYGYQEITDDVKRGILGENYLRLHGIDREELVARIKDDRWSRIQNGESLPAAWSHLRG
jgi:predicted TIM-barrel fold metal-dependent hydrolase